MKPPLMGKIKKWYNILTSWRCLCSCSSFLVAASATSGCVRLISSSSSLSLLNLGAGRGTNCQCNKSVELTEIVFLCILSYCQGIYGYCLILLHELLGPGLNVVSLHGPGNERPAHLRHRRTHFVRAELRLSGLFTLIGQ